MLNGTKNSHIKTGDLVKIKENINSNFTPGLVINVSDPTIRNPILAIHVQWPNGIDDWFYDDELIIVKEIENSSK